MDASGRARRAAIAIAGLLLLPAASAQAATVTVKQRSSGSERSAPTYGLTFTAAPGEANEVEIRRDPRAVTVRDRGAALVPQGLCTQAGDGVACPLPSEGTLSAIVELGDGSDRVSVALGPLDRVVVTGGPGDDDVAIGVGTIDGGPGADRMEVRGEFPSVISYANRPAGVRVTLDGRPDDGEAGEGDNVVGPFTSITGSRFDDHLSVGDTPTFAALNGLDGNDTLIGGNRNDELTGGPGDDVLDGGAADDDLVGAAGADRMRGGPGIDAALYGGRAGVRLTADDVADDGAAGEGDDIASDVEDLHGASGPDVLIGSDGPNRLEGGGGNDVLIGHGGDDWLLAGRGANRVVGGPGSDILMAEPKARDRIDMRDGTADFGFCGGPPRALAADRVDLLIRCVAYIKFAGGGSFIELTTPVPSVGIQCTRGLGPRCVGELRLERREAPKRLLGRVRYDLRAGERIQARFRLTAAGRRAQRAGEPVETYAYSVPAGSSTDVPSWFPMPSSYEFVVLVWTPAGR